MIINSTKDTVITGSKENDVITNSGEYVVICGVGGNNTLHSSADNVVLISGDDGDNVLIAESGISTLIGGTGNNTLTGGDGANTFIHGNGGNDTITNYNQLEDSIIIGKGVAQNLTSDDSNDVILKIVDGDSEFGTVTVKDAKNKNLAIYDESHINQYKDNFLEVADVSINAIMKTFQENADIQSIIKDGVNSEILKEIKDVDSDIAQQIADCFKSIYEAGTAYSNGVIKNSSSSDIESEILSEQTAEDSFGKMLTAVDFEATVLQNMKTAGIAEKVAGNALSKVTTPLSLGISATSYMTYSYLLYNQNIVPAWEDMGSSNSTLWQNIAKIRSYDSEVFDNWAKSNVNLAGTVLSVAAVGLMGAAGIAGAPVIITAGVLTAAPLAINWAYDKFVAPKLDETEKSLSDELKNNITNEIVPDTETWISNKKSGTYYRDGIYINNQTDGIVLFGTSRNDFIQNSGSNVNIYGGAGEDYIDNNGYSSNSSNVRIDAGAGDDDIYSVYGKNLTINAGDGDDTIISNSGSYVTINAGAGDDSIAIQYGSNNISINAGAGNDSIYSWLSYDLDIELGNGNNTVVMIESWTAGDWTIPSNVKPNTVTAGDGNNLICYDKGLHLSHLNRVANETFILGNGNNTVEICAPPSTVKCGSGNDSIIMYEDYTDDHYKYLGYHLKEEGISCSIDAGDGRNTIIAGGVCTIQTGSDNDYIEYTIGMNSVLGRYNYATITSGEGNDIINIDDHDLLSAFEITLTDFDTNDVIKLPKAVKGIAYDEHEKTLHFDSYENYEKLIRFESHEVQFCSDAKFILPNYYADWTYYENSLNYDSRRPMIYLSSDKTTIFCTGAKTASFTLNGVKSGLIKEDGTVEGIDIAANSNFVKLSQAVLDKKNVTVTEGYALLLDDDVDRIENITAKWFVKNGTATYKSGQSAGYSIVDNKIIYSEESYNEPLITISGLNADASEDDISLTGKTLTIAKSAISNATVTISVDDSVSKVSVGAGNFVFGKQTFKVSTPVEFNLNTKGEVTSYKLESAGSVENKVGNVSISGSMGNDTITNSGSNVTINGNGGNDVISGFDASDKLIIGGTYSTIKSNNDVIVTAEKGTITLKDSANLDTINIQGTFVPDESTISGSDTIPDGMTIKNGTLTADKNFTDGTVDLNEIWAADVKKINLSSLSQSLSIIGKAISNYIKGGRGADTITGDESKDTLYGGLGNDLIYGNEDNDVLKGDAGADTIDGGEGTNTLTGGAGKDVFIHSEGEDVITDYVAGQDKIMVNTITGDSLKGSDIILFTDNGNVTVKGGKNKKITVIDGENNSTTKVYGQYNYSESNTKLALTSGFNGTLNADDYDSAVEEINATAIIKSGRINGNGNNNVIIGSARNDSINGNGENNTLTGGNGNDVFIHEKGDDLITDYTAGKDKIKLLGVTITSAELDENDLILKTSNGTITVAEGKGKKITVVDAKNKTTTAEYPLFLEGLMYDKKNVVLTATTDFTGETIDLTDYYSTTTRVNANAVKHAISIYGNDSNNSIKGGKGSDTIYGGKGNDTLTGGTGKDIFVYESGDDVITDYKAGQDTIKLEGVSITGSTIKSSNIILQTDEGSLTIKSGRNKKITVIDSSGNETTQVYGNSSALIEDDNLFNVEDVTIDEITEVEVGVNLKLTDENIYKEPELVIVEGQDDKNNLLK